LVDKNDLTGEAVDPPVVQHVEMGRDQAHGAGDVTNAEILARLLLAQGTKVDPVEGTVSTAPNAVGPYEFLDDRILHAAEYFAKFMLGYDTSWIPNAAHTDANGNPTIIYKELSQQYRGRLTQNNWELFYYYKYTAGINIEEKAPYFTQMFADRVSYNWDGVDGGGDFWLFAPKAAETEGTKYLVKPIIEPLREMEDRYTAFDSNSTAKQEGDTSFVEIKATEAGSKIALVGSSTGEKSIGFKIRTNGVAKLEMSYSINDTLTLPDTKGKWRFVTYTMNDFQGLGDLIYFNIRGAGTTVDIDHMNVKAGVQLTSPVFTAGNAALHLFTYVGSQAAINTDFPATDPSATDVVTYQIDNKPEGAAFNESTGAFSWKPTQAGTYSFVVGASDGTTVTAKDIKVVVANDRQSAVSAVIAPFDANTSYISSTFDHYKNAYADVMNLISSASDDVFYQKLADLNHAVEGLQQLTPLLNDGSMNYANMFVSSTFGTQYPNLLDNYAGSFVGYYLAQNLSYVMDFGPSFKVSANAFALQVRASFPERIGGVAVFGSNDNENWTRLTPGLTTVTEEMQRLEVQDGLKDAGFRFLEMQMIEPATNLFSGAPMIEIAEFRIFGERHEVVNNKLAAVSIGSDQSSRNRVVAGSTIKLSFKSTEAISNVNVIIQGQAAFVSTVDNFNWIATLVVDNSVIGGKVNFSIHYNTAAGIEGAETVLTTDGSTLYIADETGLIRDLLKITALSDSSGRAQADLLKTASALFDGNVVSITDFRVNGSGYGGYITFDFKAGNQVTLAKAELLARQDSNYTRISGAVVQGSNDNTAWTTISPAAAKTAEWQTLSISSKVPYRYIRIYNGNNWFGNMAELRLYGDVRPADLTPPADAVLTADITVPTNHDVSVTISYPSDVSVMEYKVGDSGTWTAYGAPVVVSENVTVYARGTDDVGNVSNVTSITVNNIYKIAPVTTATLSPAAPNGKNSWYTTDVTVSLSVYANVYGGAVTTEYQVNDGAWITYTGTIPAFGEGTYKFGYRSTDQAGNVEQLKTVEFKVDKTAPSLTVQLDKTSIWPANHKMVTVNATLNSSDAISGVESVVLTSITSNQPDSGQGDIQANLGTATTSFILRAEKPRIYTITYTATDKAGNKTVTTASVTVPHDQSGNN
jgi:hypothetical protein